MKNLLFIFLLFSFSASAQLKSFKLTSNGDTINRVDAKGLKQGPWIVNMPELRGERGYEEEGYYENDKKDGTWRRYSLDGDLIAMENYRWGHKDGRNQYFNYQGEPLREEFWKAIDPQNPYDTVKVYDVNDPTKIKGIKLVKIENASVKHGTWKYYDNFTGKIETEKWVMDRLKSEMEEDDMAPIDVTDATASKKDEKKPATKPKEVLEFEKKNAGKKKIKVRTGSTGG